MTDGHARLAAEWRLLRGWSDAELWDRLDRASLLPRNWDGPAAESWERHRSSSVLGRESPGGVERDGPFEHGKEAVRGYAFSDPSIVEAHFDATRPLEGRRMILEIKPLLLRYLCPVIVSSVRVEETEDRIAFGFRYDTLEGHLEQGSEWFVLQKDTVTGELTFRIEAAWKYADFPNWWTRLGFHLLRPHYAGTWHRRAHQRMAAFTAGRSVARRDRLHE